MKPQIEYATDPNKRCMYCKGREVKTYMSGTLIELSLEEVLPNKFRCKDVKECQQNIEGENTALIISEKGFKFMKNNKETLIEIEYDKSIF